MLEDKVIIDLYINEKKSLRDISKILKIDRARVSRILKNNNITIKKASQMATEQIAIGEDTENKIIDMYTSGYLPYEIKEKLNIGNTTIFRTLKKYNISTKGYAGIKKSDPIENRTFVVRTTELEKEISKKYLEGKSAGELADKYHVSKKFILMSLRSTNTEIRLNQALSIEEEKELIDIYLNTNSSVKLIADKYSVTTGTVYNIFKKYNVTVKGNNKFQFEDIEDNVIFMYEKGESSKTIASMYSVSSSTIEKILKRKNITIRDESESKQIYSLDKTFFNSIDTEVRAYILGLLYADGNNSKTNKRNTFRIGLNINDKCVLEEINSYFKSNRPLYYRKEHLIGKDMAKPSYTLSITNKYVSDVLVQLGLVNAKTHILKYPTWLDKDLHRHFIRGYFDGDGCLSGSFSIAGVYDFLYEIQTILMEACQLNRTKLTSTKSIYSLFYGGTNQLKRIYAYLYKDATIYFERKKKKFSERIKIEFKSREIRKPFGSELNLDSFIQNNELIIPTDMWRKLNEQYDKELIKQSISNTIQHLPLPYKNITKEDALHSFRNLCSLDSKTLINQGKLYSRYAYENDLGLNYITSSRIGNEASDYFHQQDRYKCDSINSPSPYRVWNTNQFKLTLLNSLWSLNVPEINNVIFRQCLHLRKYVASQFRPSTAKVIYELYNSKYILDFSAGWGDRLAAFYSCSNTKMYVGIDPNKNLFPNYKKQIELYNKPEKKFLLIDTPAEDTDLSEYEFDTIFTSPPYYNIERYTQDETQSWKRYKKLNDWNEEFLFKVINKSWTALKKNGYLIINMSDNYSGHTVNKICDPMNYYISKLSGSNYIGCLGMQLAKRLNTKASAIKGIFVEPIWIWQKK